MTELVVRRKCLEIEGGRAESNEDHCLTRIASVTRQLRQFRSDLLHNDEKQAGVLDRAHKNARLRLTADL